MTSFLTFLIALFKAIPALKELWDELVAAYVQMQVESIKKENREAIRKAIDEQDQRDLERAMGSPRAGELSGVPGSEIRDQLPGVQ